jgi:DNA-binding NarL/FixJ family response regulator
MTSPEKIRLLLVDDHAVMRAGLESVLNTNPRFQVVAGASDAVTALALYTEHLPDVVLLDIHMPHINGIECLRRLRAAHPEARVLMLTSSEAEEDIFQALEAGALGYVLKTACPEELNAAIAEAHRGEHTLSATVQSRLAERSATSLLTAREMEVLHYVRKGLSNVEIGSLLHVSMHTAKAHVAALLKKLEAADRAEAVARAFERGLLKP